MSAARTRAMSERELQDAIVQAARTLGYLVYHATDARRSEPGFPDLVIVGHGLVCFWECKRHGGRLRPATVSKSGRVLPGQRDWLYAITRATKVDAHVVYPVDLDDALSLLQRGYEEAMTP